MKDNDPDVPDWSTVERTCRQCGASYRCLKSSNADKMRLCRKHLSILQNQIDEAENLTDAVQ